MGIIQLTNVIPGTFGPYLTDGAPSAGTSEVQTLTIGGTPSGDTFTISWNGFTTAAITWSATNATLLANINTALNALPNLGDGDLVATAGSLTAGVGTVLLTFSANETKKAQALATATRVSGAGTYVITETTPGVTATARTSGGAGTSAVDITNGKEYINTGTAAAPTWTVKGAQS